MQFAAQCGIMRIMGDEGILHKMVIEKPPAEWASAEIALFMRAAEAMDEPPDRSTKYGDKFHICQSWHDFKYFSAETIQFGYKEIKLPGGNVQGRGLIFNDPEWPGHDRMVDILLSHSIRKIILSPRGSYKSTLLACYVVWRIGRNRNMRICYATETLKKARGYVNQFMTLMQAAEYIHVFGKMRGTSGWSKDGLFVSNLNRMSKEATITPAGVDAGITGDHQDIVICDDVVSFKNTRTRDGIRKTIDWYAMLAPILDPGSMLINNGTRYHDADLHGEIIRKSNDADSSSMERYDTLVLSAENEDTTPYFKHLTRPILNISYSELGPYGYSCQYLNNPVSSEDQLFYREQFKLISEREVPTTHWKYLLCDSATTTTVHSSRTAMWIVGVDQARRYYCLDLQVGMWKPDEVVDRLFALYMKWRPRWATMESNVHGRVYKSYIDLENRIRQINMRIRLIMGRNEQSKFQRITALQPLFESNRIFFVDTLDKNLISRQGKKVYGDIVDEFIRFPKAMRDDIPDALADIIASDREGQVCPHPRTGDRYRGSSSVPIDIKTQRVITKEARYRETKGSRQPKPVRAARFAGRRPDRSNRWGGRI